jgi:hypothetical protein
MRYTVRKKKFEHVDIGSMNHRITVEVRSLMPPVGEDTNYGLSFITDISVWAMMDTVNGLTVFDGENIERVVTHNFYIRYLPNLTFEKWIKYYNQYSNKTNRYRIYRVEDLGEEHKFYKLYTGLAGDIGLEASKA